MSQLFTLREVCETLGVDSACIQSFVQREWILPAGDGETEQFLDDCDLARAQLILELQQTFGANDESIPVILHLIDQIHALRERLLQAQPVRFGRA